MADAIPTAATAPVTNPTETTNAQTGTVATGASADPKAGATQSAAQEAMAKRKLKIDDQEIDEDEVLKVYRERKGHQSAANKILQEGKAEKKKAETFIQMMKDKEKLFEAIQKLGHDPRKLAEEYLSAQLEDELMDPREKELKMTKAELQRYKEEERLKQEAKEREANEAMKKRYSDEYSAQFVEALKQSNLPPTKAMVAEMAKYIHRAAGLNFQMTAQEAAQLVREDIEAAHKRLYGEADADTLVRLLGDQGLQKIRTYDTSRLKDPNANLRTPENQPEAGTRVKSSGKRMTPQEWRAYNRSK